MSEGMVRTLVEVDAIRAPLVGEPTTRSAVEGKVPAGTIGVAVTIMADGIICDAVFDFDGRCWAAFNLVIGKPALPGQTSADVELLDAITAIGGLDA